MKSGGIRNEADGLLALIRAGAPMTLRQQLKLAALLSVPAIMAQFSSILMQYIDAAMVGSLGAEAAASIGLISTTTWLFSGSCTAASMGFCVQVAHAIGAGDMERARMILRQALVAVFLFGILLGVAGVSISPWLPSWLGGGASICDDSSAYFLIYSSFLPVFQLYVLAGGMLRCSGNMHVPSILSVLMCVLDVVFNFFLIFPSRELQLGGVSLWLPGAGWGVEGAALGTGLAELVAAGWMMWYLCSRSALRLPGFRGSFRLTGGVLKKAFRIGFPMGVEHGVICGAQIMTTVIVAPLGIFSIAANSFAITAESLCYMPGYGIADAATTLVGQSYGAGRTSLARRFAAITVSMGMLVMGLMGIVMYVWAPQIIGSMTPDAEVLSLGVMALRIEAFAEPMFAAAIVAYGVCVGAGKTVAPCLMNFFSIWAVRLVLAALLAPSMGLKGVWLAMCIELCFRGTIFLLYLKTGRWLKKQPLAAWEKP